MTRYLSALNTYGELYIIRRIKFRSLLISHYVTILAVILIDYYGGLRG